MALQLQSKNTKSTQTTPRPKPRLTPQNQNSKKPYLFVASSRRRVIPTLRALRALRCSPLGIYTTTQRRDGRRAVFQYSFRDPSGSWVLGWLHSSSPKIPSQPRPPQGSPPNPSHHSSPRPEIPRSPVCPSRRCVVVSSPPPLRPSRPSLFSPSSLFALSGSPQTNPRH